MALIRILVHEMSMKKSILTGVEIPPWNPKESGFIFFDGHVKPINDLYGKITVCLVYDIQMKFISQIQFVNIVYTNKPSVKILEKLLHEPCLLCIHFDIPS